MVDSKIVNVGLRLSETARINPQGVGVVMPAGRDRSGRRRYQQLTFRELDEDSNRLAAGILSLGVPSGSRLVLMVRPSIDFISLVFAMFKANVVTVLIDPGMGRQNLFRCLEEIQPDGFIAIPMVQAAQTWMRHRFPKARFNVTVGSRWLWRGPNIEQFRAQSCELKSPQTVADDPAAVIFTTGSTGPPKGVLYRHGNFDRQVDEIRDRYHIRPGELDLPGFPLFALFNAAMGVTTVIPEMDFTRPANADPRNIIEPIHDWQITQAFGSPALWNVVGRYCEQHHIQLPTLQRVLSAGAPVPPHVLRRMKNAIHPAGEIYTPYGATEALPVASISASEVLNETAAHSAIGAGTCVGSRFPGIRWKIIPISDEPIFDAGALRQLPTGEIGELIVQGGVVTREYVTRVDANPLHKIIDGDCFWHRMGDVGYLDEQNRFWFCGRKSHRIRTSQGVMFTIPCEAIFNQHPHVYRSALVGVGAPAIQRPVIVVEPWPEHRPANREQREKLVKELLALGSDNRLTRNISDVLVHPAMPVDIRHNAKIFREKLAAWATVQLGRNRVARP